MKVLVTYNIPANHSPNWEKEHTITMPEGEYFTEELIKLVPDYDVILGIFTHFLSIMRLSRPGKS